MLFVFKIVAPNCICHNILKRMHAYAYARIKTADSGIISAPLYHLTCTLMVVLILKSIHRNTKQKSVLQMAAPDEWRSANFASHIIGKQLSNSTSNQLLTRHVYINS